jgi:hypothetical protein
MKKENADNPNPTVTSGDPSEGEGLPPAHGKAAWTTPTLTALSAKDTEGNAHAQVVGDDAVVGS